MPDLPIRSLGFSVRTAMVVDRLGVRTVADLAALTDVDLLVGRFGNRLVVGEVRRALRPYGLDLAAVRTRDLPPPDPPRYDWGCLHVRHDDFGTVRSRVIEVYARAGLVLAPTSAAPKSFGDLAGPNRDPLGDDEVLVLDEPTPGWIAVASARWEWAPPAAHPLAIELSRTLDVVGITSVASRYAEITRYRDGAPIQCTLTGEGDAPDLPDVDLAWFEDKGAAVGAEDLQRYVGDPERFVGLAGPDLRGLRDRFEAAPLDDYPPDAFLVFRGGSAAGAEAPPLG